MLTQTFLFDQQASNGLCYVSLQNGLLSNSLNDMFLLKRDVHSYNTRKKNSFLCPAVCVSYELCHSK